MDQVSSDETPSFCDFLFRWPSFYDFCFRGPPRLRGPRSNSRGSRNTLWTPPGTWAKKSVMFSAVRPDLRTAPEPSEHKVRQGQGEGGGDRSRWRSRARSRTAYERTHTDFARIPTRPSNDKLGVSKKGLSPLDLPPGLIRTVLSSREPPRAQISIK